MVTEYVQQPQVVEVVQPTAYATQVLQPQVVQPQVVQPVMQAAPVQYAALPQSETAPLQPRYVKPTKTVYAEGGVQPTYAAAPVTYAAPAVRETVEVIQPREIIQPTYAAPAA